jgi:phytoene dehydrogenase-like protein
MAVKNFYDAILVGLSLPTLLAGGLLAKRGFRVLIVGQGQPLPAYSFQDMRLLRASSTLYAYDSPAVSRVFAELALKPLMRRRVSPLTPSFQVILPQHRLDFSAAPDLVTREVEREFPVVRRAADDFVRAAQRSWERLNRLVERDLVWPPGSFFERREFTRAAVSHPFGKDDAPGPLSELAEDQPLRAMINTALRFADGSGVGSGNPQRELRQISALLHAAELLDGGLWGLWELLIDSIRTHNGEVRANDRIDRISVQRGAVESVRLSPSDEELGCQFVLSGLSVAKLSRLLSDRRGMDQLLDELGSPSPRAFRYMLNVVVHADAIPEGLARNVLLLNDGAGAPLGARDKRDPHARRAEDALRIETNLLDRERALISAEMLLPVQLLDSGEKPLASLREHVLERLLDLSPFLRDHLLWIDSPHDGRPIQDARSGASIEPEDAHRRGPESMPTVYAYPHKGTHGCTALPLRTPIKRLLLCNEQVVPGLGQEGLFLTSWSAARVVARSLGRQWMNRGRWTKVEL